jgi:hypothetical protein
LGEARFVLGIEIRRNRKARTLHISQGAYIKSILANFGMDQCTTTQTPMEKGMRLVKATDNDPLALDAAGTRDYQSRVGALVYAMQGTRPDIAYAVTALSQFSTKPTTQHQQAVKRVFRYLRGTLDHGITYRGEGNKNSMPPKTRDTTIAPNTSTYDTTMSVSEWLMAPSHWSTLAQMIWPRTC